MKKRTAGTWRNILDKLTSLAVRSRGKCQRCGKNDGTLQCAHIYSRSNKEVRWDLRNLLCLCAGCHFWAHKNPLEFTEFVKKVLGENYEKLRIVARKTRQWFEEDYKRIEEELKKEIKKYE